MQTRFTYTPLRYCTYDEQLQRKKTTFQAAFMTSNQLKLWTNLYEKNGLQAHVRHTNGQEGPNRFLGVKAGEDEHLHQARETLVS